MIRRDPVGVVAQIAPWNYPLMMAAWKIAPSLAAGNSVIFMPSENTPLTMLALAPLFKEIFPAVVLNIIAGNGPEAGAELAKHPRVEVRMPLVLDFSMNRQSLKGHSSKMKLSSKRSLVR
jgi:aminobutyraldehyde dehydrogenase